MGQAAGEIRRGDARTLAHMFAVLVNEYVLLEAAPATADAQLTVDEFHALVDGALRRG